jgi:Arc/MetJ family transcription regulator
MRTNVEIDDELLSPATAAAGLPTKRATVEEGLRLLVRMRRQAEVLEDLKGQGLGRKPRCNASAPFSGLAVILVDTDVWIAHLGLARFQGLILNISLAKMLIAGSNWGKASIQCKSLSRSLSPPFGNTFSIRKGMIFLPPSPPTVNSRRM